MFSVVFCLHSDPTGFPIDSPNEHRNSGKDVTIPLLLFTSLREVIVPLHHLIDLNFTMSLHCTTSLPIVPKRLHQPVVHLSTTQNIWIFFRLSVSSPLYLHLPPKIIFSWRKRLIPPSTSLTCVRTPVWTMVPQIDCTLYTMSCIYSRFFNRILWTSLE